MLPAEVRRFILTSIPSVPHLEALLLLHSEPTISWTAETLSQRLYVSEKKARELLLELSAANIAIATAAPDRFSYCPEYPEINALVDRLATLYSTDLLEITHLIHSKLDRRAQQFADAFKLRKDP